MEVYFQLITDAESLHRAVEDLSKYDFIGFDTETTELDPYDGDIRLVQLAAPDSVRVIDLKAFGAGNGGNNGANIGGSLKTNPDLEPLRRLLEAKIPVKIAHNAKFDAKWVKHHLGIELGGVFDTYLASQLVSAGDTDHRHSLAEVVLRYLNQEVDKTEQISDWSGELSQSQLEYAAKDAAILLPLQEKLAEKLRLDELERCAAIEFESILPIVAMELAGVNLDKELWRSHLEQVGKKQAHLADDLQDILSAGAIQSSLFGRTEINLDSQQQVLEALQRIGVPIGDSTRHEILEKLAPLHPPVEKLIEYRAVQKQLTSFGENILEYISPATGRIHADFRQIGAPTGRFSCSHPNLQQVPHEDEYRRCFSAPAGRKLIVADYSQIELRILADFSNDVHLIEAFKSGADFHRQTAAQVFGVKPEEVTPAQRTFAKRLNFGVVYGIGASRFADLTKIGESEAEQMLRRYFNNYRGLDTWLRNTANDVIKNRTARTGSGRLMRFRFDPDNPTSIGSAKRVGKNMPIQGTSADILKRAMRLLYDDLKNTSAKLVNVIHDEIVVESGESESAEVAQIVEKAMTSAGEEFVSKVPIKVEIKIAADWAK
ncbi:MAG TPA: DNA polymerase [Pyrinomonadaceae bacterium]|jgi:DNA polymerase-1|nr:DNA polymerase [Pyrinomonadaceae bacterium]